MRKKKKISSHTRHAFPNLLMVAVGILFAVALSKFQPFHEFLFSLHQYGYFAAFVAGLLYVSTFTVATGAVMLLVLAEKLSIWELGLIAGLGGVVGDLIIFHIVRDGLLGEIQYIFQQVGGKKLRHLFHTKAFRWMLPVMGVIIIMSPFPDELGVSLLGISKMNSARFMVLSFILDTLGVFLILSLSLVLKP